MELTPSQQESLSKRLSALWGDDFRCPACGGQSLSVGDRLFALVEFDPGRPIMRPGQSVVPTIPVTCARCGNTLLVNAIATELVSQNGEGANQSGPEPDTRGLTEQRRA